jgi:hypothetical protein
VGFDPVTGIVHAPQALPLEEIHGCGGASCSSHAGEPGDARDLARAAETADSLVG